MAAVIARIILRYGAGFLVAKGLLAPEAGAQLSTDPDVQMLIQVGAGGVAFVVSECWYFFAKRVGWTV